MAIKSCFRGLGAGLARHLDDPEQRLLFDYHRDRIANGFSEHSDLKLNQDLVAGFLNGFMTAVSCWVPEGSVEQESVFPVLGGIYLLGSSSAYEAKPGAGDGFAVRLAMVVASTVDEIDPVAQDGAEDLIRTTFAGSTPDVAITRNSLAGFALGVLYSRPYLPEDVPGPDALLSAVSRMASDAEPDHT